MDRLAAALALALLAAPGARAAAPTSSSGATPKPAAVADGGAACTAAKERTRAALGEHQACSADWDCERWMTWALGCDGVVASRAGAKDLAQALADACTGIPAKRLDCAGKIPACVDGRCRFRERAGKGCDAAKAAYRARLDAAPTACQEDPECLVRPRPDGTERAVAARFAREAARETHAFEDACVAPGATWPKESRSLARCAEGTCQLAERGAGDSRKPRPEDTACFHRALKAEMGTLSELGAAEFQVRFAVNEDGRIGPFQFSRKLPPPVEAAIARAALSCKWQPGRVSGEARSTWLAIPIRLKG